MIEGNCEGFIPSYGYSTESCKCEKFTYTGCGGNGNQFTILEECLKTCESACEPKPYLTCLLPADGLVCNDTEEKYFFDRKSCRCTKVSGKACKGKKLFESKINCETSCKDMACPTTVCNQPKDLGDCNMLMKRFFFNKHTCQCEEFTFTGCGGNRNRYATLEECEAICGPVECPVCNLPPSKGKRCKKAKQQRKWYYDAAKCKCKAFTYRGCEGNSNRFDTEGECMESCGSAPCPVCSLAKDSGSCNKNISRYYYNSKKKKCMKFKWGGCSLNLNNFFKKKDCDKVCKKARIWTQKEASKAS